MPWVAGTMSTDTGSVLMNKCDTESVLKVNKVNNDCKSISSNKVNNKNFPQDENEVKTSSQQEQTNTVIVKAI